MSKLKKRYLSVKDYIQDFCEKIGKESNETKEAFSLIIDSTFNGVELTEEEKNQIGNQMRDILKTIGVVGITMLLGGSIFLILTNVLKINKHVLPSAFLEPKEKN